MSTNSTITVRTSDKERLSVYCHWDGYPRWNGLMLVKHYNTFEKAKELVEGGDISALRQRVKPNEGEEHSFDKPLEDVTIFYRRDRGEENVEPTVLKNSDSIEWQQFNYYFDGSDWYLIYRDGKRLKLNEEYCENHPY